MSGVMERTLSILELLAQHGDGLELGTIAERLNIPRSGVHRLLTDLVAAGYVRQLRDHGDYMLTTKLVSIGLMFLSKSGIIDMAQPLLNRLAEISGELVRLSVIDGDRLTWVARAQGARQGLRYDPDMGSDARLSCSSSGWAWLSTLSDDEAIGLVARQGLGKRDEFGPNAPETMTEVLAAIAQTRQRGFAITCDTYTEGLSAISAPVRLTGQPAMGVLTIAGPSARFKPERMEALGGELVSFAAQLAAASGASPFFNPSQRSAGGLPPGERKPIYAD